MYRRGLLDRGEAQWLRLLFEFDRDQLWALDGQLSCVAWLVWRMKMARGTAFEKVRIAHELSRRPIVADAFTAGDLSYSAVRAITRLEDPDPAVDRALVELAKVGTVHDLEQALRRYQLCAEQERAGTLQAADRRGIRIHRGLDGFSTIEIILEDTELDELVQVLRAATDQTDPTDLTAESPRGDSDRADWLTPEALLDLARTGLAHLGDETVVGADRYMVHLIVNAAAGQAKALDGTPIPPAVAERIACDASWVAHVVGAGDEPLALGRRTREWSTAQHRAIRVRDGGACRFPGCANRITDIHHVRYWSAGGDTDIDNGLLLCQRHHTLAHEGFAARGSANSTVEFFRPDGTPIGTTRPLSQTCELGVANLRVERYCQRMNAQPPPVPAGLR